MKRRLKRRGDVDAQKSDCKWGNELCRRKGRGKQPRIRRSKGEVILDEAEKGVPSMRRVGAFEACRPREERKGCKH